MIKNNRYLYAYFGRLEPNPIDIPGHFLYQPFLLEEICRKICPDDNYSVDIYSYVNDIKNDGFGEGLIEPIITFDHLLPGVKDMMNNFAYDHITNADGTSYVSLGKVLKNIKDGVYDVLILKARFRNPSTHAKKIYDVRKFETIVETGIKKDIPILIVDTDLSLPQNFIEGVVNKNYQIKIIALGDISKAYPTLDPHRIAPTGYLYGLDYRRMMTIYHFFEKHPEVIKHASRGKNLLYYGNIAFQNYKEGHTKNTEVLDYLIKLAEEPFFSQMHGYIIGKVENKNYITSGYNHIKRYERKEIAKLHSRARLSVNISKILYEMTDFSPARITESWIYGVIPLSYSKDGNYQNNRTIVFRNYYEFVECVRLYLVDTDINDYYKMFMSLMKNCLEYRTKERS